MTRTYTRISGMYAVCFLLATAYAAPTQALTFLVGAVPSVCDYSTLQQAINAAASVPGEDFIRVANDQSYNTQALNIGQQDLTITGGYANCSAALPPDAVPTGSTILNGAGGSPAAVMRITGAGVRVLMNLQIRNGDNNGACGGGIGFFGHGVLAIHNSGIAQNTATAGGGICFQATASPAILSIGADVTINNNTATSGGGGGIWIGGPARLSMVSDNTLVAFNSALNGDGGGVYMQAPARADIGSPGTNGLGVLYANEARRGGGVAGYAPENSGEGHSCLRLFTTDSTRPIRIHNNRASIVGGGLYLRTDAGGLMDFFRIVGRAYDFRIDGNTAPNGAAIFLDGDETAVFKADFGSLLWLNDDTIYADCNEPLFELGRVGCTNRAECNRIENNRSEDFNGQPTNGNVIELQDNSKLYGKLFTMAGNVGTRLLSSSGGEFGGVELEQCALIANTLTQELFRGFNDSGSLDLKDCTIAGNSIGNTHVLRHDSGDAENTLENVLIDQPGKLTLAHPNVSATNFSIINQWVLASDTSTLRPDPTAQPLQGRARFVDVEHGDYHLRIGSIAVDYTPRPSPLIPNDVDLDARARNIDLQEVSALFGARDVGAYERQLSDRWLPNGDFVSDLRLWSNPNPLHSTWTAAFNAPGSAGGSLTFLVPADQVGPNERRTALTQCFNVPSPGEYQVSGRAISGGSMTADYPVLNWRLRYNSDDCSGAESASGDRFFGQSASWQPLTSPLFINVEPAPLWNWNTTIEVRLEVAQNPGSPTATSLFSRFDEIEISKQTIVLFANGFE